MKKYSTNIHVVQNAQGQDRDAGKRARASHPAPSSCLRGKTGPVCVPGRESRGAEHRHRVFAPGRISVHQMKGTGVQRGSETPSPEDCSVQVGDGPSMASGRALRAISVVGSDGSQEEKTGVPGSEGAGAGEGSSLGAEAA